VTVTELRTEKVEISVAGVSQTMPAYVAVPKGPTGPRPAVMVFEEIFGVNAHIREVTDRVAALGYVAIAPDIHHRAGRGLELGYDAAGRQQGMQLIPKLTRDGVLADLEATRAYLERRGDVKADRLGCMGFCIGGHVAYLAAESGLMRASASFYGGGIATFSPGGGAPTVSRTGDIKGKLLCFFGKDDAMIPMAQIDQIRSALTEHKIRHEVIVYEGAGHAFFCDKPERGAYRAEAAADAWERVKRLFAEEL
jgi:carboxymethylenebutenolidase